MKTLPIIIIATLFSTAAYAAGDCIGCTYYVPKPSDPPGSVYLDNVPIKQNPFDGSHLNESPIRGQGRISVVHNEPLPGDPDAEINKAVRLLQDNGYRISRARK